MWLPTTRKHCISQWWVPNSMESLRAWFLCRLSSHSLRTGGNFMKLNLTNLWPISSSTSILAKDYLLKNLLLGTTVWQFTNFWKMFDGIGRLNNCLKICISIVFNNFILRIKTLLYFYSTVWILYNLFIL